MSQYYKIAGLTVKMDTFGRTADLAIPYQMEKTAEVDLTLEADYCKIMEQYPQITPDSCEYTAKGREFYLKLIDFDGMLLHASAIAYEGKAYLFTADSGVGKSTHTSLWRRVFGDEQIKILNDDKPALRLEDGVWYAYGTPWSGKYGLNLNLKYPIAGICFLKQGKENKIEKYRKSDLIFQLMQQTSTTPNTEVKMKLLDRIEGLVQKVPVWFMECNTQPEAAKTAYQAMSKQEVTDENKE